MTAWDRITPAVIEEAGDCYDMDWTQDWEEEEVASGGVE
jgi:hypothetical protein